MSIVKNDYGMTKDGSKITAYTLEGSRGMKAVVLDYGAILDRLYVPNPKGEVVDVTLSSGNASEYAADTFFFGSTVGPNANRIAGASFEIDGVTYNMDKNDGENNLHTNIPDGLNRRMWKAAEGDNSVTFTITLKDGEYGMPGNRTMSVTYSLNSDNELKIEYNASSDKKTIFNMTNHSYFNLSGHDSGSVLDHELTMHCSNYTEIVKGAIPTGKIVSVLGTVLDFTKSKKVGQDIEADNEQMKLVNGYDFNYVVDGFDGTLREIAILHDPASGRTMKVLSDLPGVQLYTGNWIENAPGKDGAVYEQRYGLCLETQDYPDSIHHENFPDVVYGPGRDYHTVTIYRFE